MLTAQGGRTQVPADASDSEQHIDHVRRFNRFYTRTIGVLQDGYLHSPFSLAEVRVLYELAHRQRATATELARELDLDAGYLSRILGGFDRRGLLDRTKSERDGRESVLMLNGLGHAAFTPLEANARAEIGALLARLPQPQQHQLVGAMRTIEGLLGDKQPDPAAYVLRQHRPGDMGWVVQRHGALYAQEYGFDEQFEALVASIVAKFIQHLDPDRERCWIAERDGHRVGCIFLVKASQSIGKLRLFLVEPEARGAGLGHALVDDCIHFARLAGYRKVRLWTQSSLLAARHLYVQAGFSKIQAEPHHSYSQDLVAETWELRL
jgi:DNA-binding MarR family transcriptional regulator/N-acetylglutamate synthase-like GNAT family acetyltransferase